jgi:hypothetical protein
LWLQVHSRKMWQFYRPVKMPQYSSRGEVCVEQATVEMPANNFVHDDSAWDTGYTDSRGENI